jgi:hypothetical protein
VEERIGLTRAMAQEMFEEAVKARFAHAIDNLSFGYVGSASQRIKGQEDFRYALDINIAMLSFVARVLEEKIKD